MDITQVADLFTCFSEASIFFLLYEAFLIKRKNLNKYIYIAGVLVLAVSIYVSNHIFSLGILNLLCIFISCEAVSLLYDGKWQMRIFSSALGLMSSVMAEMLVFVCMSAIFNLDASIIVDNTLYRIFGIITSEFLGIAMAFFVYHRAKKLEDLRGTNYWFLFSFVFASVIISSYVFFVIISKGADIRTKYLILAATAGIMITSVIILYLYETMLRQHRQMLQQQLEQRQLQEQLRHYNAMISSQSEVKQLKHDLKNHLLSVQAKLDKKEYSQCSQYIETLLEKVRPDTGNEINTGNTVLDAIISAKRSEAEKNNISFYSEIRIPPELPLKEDDVCIIFGNALDNAIEACEKVETNPYISVSVVYDDDSLICRIENSCAENVDIHNVTSKEDWKNHGIGRSNIEKSLSNYDCVYDVSCEDNKYVLSIVFMDISYR